jgi:ketosteroid isomerase-like protein
MTTENWRAANESEIRALIDDRTKAVRAKDSVGATSGIVPDILTFDVENPLQQIGSTASRKRADEWSSSFRDQIGYEIRDLDITAGDDVGLLPRPLPRQRDEDRRRTARYVVAQDRLLPQDRGEVDGNARA